MERKQTPTKKDFMIVYGLGRETTPYEVAKQYYKLYFGRDLDPKADVSKFGPFYSAKSELLKKGLLIETKVKGREKLITTNIEKYLDYLFEGVFETDDPFYLDFKRIFVGILQKIGSKIVDLSLNIDPYILQTSGDIAFPFLYSFFAGILGPMLQNEASAEKFMNFFDDMVTEFKNRKDKIPVSYVMIPQIFNYIRSLDPKTIHELTLSNYISEKERSKLFICIVAISPKKLLKEITNIFIKITNTFERQE